MYGILCDSMSFRPTMILGNQIARPDSVALSAQDRSLHNVSAVINSVGLIYPIFLDTVVSSVQVTAPKHHDTTTDGAIADAGCKATTN